MGLKLPNPTCRGQRDTAVCPRVTATLHFCPRRVLEAAQGGTARLPADTAPNSVPSARLVVGEVMRQVLCH